MEIEIGLQNIKGISRLRSDTTRHQAYVVVLSRIATLALHETAAATGAGAWPLTCASTIRIPGQHNRTGPKSVGAREKRKASTSSCKRQLLAIVVAMSDEYDENDLQSLMSEEGLSRAEAKFCLWMAPCKQPERKNSNTTVWQAPQE